MKFQIEAPYRIRASEEWATTASTVVLAEIDYYKGIRSYVDDTLGRKISSKDLENLVYKTAKLKIPDLEALDKWLKNNKAHWATLEDAVGEGIMPKGVTVPANIYRDFNKLYNALY